LTGSQNLGFEALLEQRRKLILIVGCVCRLPRGESDFYVNGSQIRLPVALTKVVVLRYLDDLLRTE